MLLGNTVSAQKNAKRDTVPTISPMSFGLAEAETDSARYEVLFATHSKAVKKGMDVSYAGIDTLVIEVTANSNPIPLTRHNNFSGITLLVKNNAKTHYLF